MNCPPCECGAPNTTGWPAWCKACGKTFPPPEGCGVWYAPPGRSPAAIHHSALDQWGHAGKAARSTPEGM